MRREHWRLGREACTLEEHRAELHSVRPVREVCDIAQVVGVFRNARATIAGKEPFKAKITGGGTYLAFEQSACVLEG